ncbi:MAG TPA: hypothetical protein VGL60_00685 [Acidimicrobiales bacterium]|jgi:hypothetical protein
MDPLLRELLDFGLVEVDPDRGGWRLVESASRRLTELAAPRPPADKIIYFGHRCSSCGELRPTRIYPGGLMCDECRLASEDGWVPPAVATQEGWAGATGPPASATRDRWAGPASPASGLTA